MNNSIFYKIAIGVLLVVTGFCVVALQSPDIHRVVDVAPKSFLREDFDGEVWLRIFGSWDPARHMYSNDGVNSVFIECGRMKLICSESYATVDRLPEEGGAHELMVNRTDYEVVLWTETMVRAERRFPEVTHELSIDLITEDVTLLERPNFSEDGEPVVTMHVLK